MAACHPLCESARGNFVEFVLKACTQLPLTGKVVLVLSSGGTSCPSREHLVLGPRIRGMASSRTTHSGPKRVLMRQHTHALLNALLIRYTVQ